MVKQEEKKRKEKDRLVEGGNGGVFKNNTAIESNGGLELGI